MLFCASGVPSCLRLLTESNSMPGATVLCSHYEIPPCNRVKQMGTNKSTELKACFCEVRFIATRVNTQELKVMFHYYLLLPTFQSFQYVPTEQAPEQASAAVAV